MLKIYANSSHRRHSSSFGLTLIVAFYNNIEFFKLVWASIEKQTLRDFEVIICDDGSRAEIVSQLQKILERSAIATKHLWHEDQGFRKNRIMNYGIRESRAERIVFIDGDCILHPEFLFEHFLHGKGKTVLAGRRLDLSPGISKSLTTEKIQHNYVEKNLFWIIPAISWRKDNNGPKGIYLRHPTLRRWFNRAERGIVGCNFSAARADLMQVNGFDNRYEAPGTGEDSDLEFRLRLMGVKIEPFCHAAVQYHLWHKLQKRPMVNEELFLRVQRDRVAVTPDGIGQLV